MNNSDTIGTIIVLLDILTTIYGRQLNESYYLRRTWA